MLRRAPESSMARMRVHRQAAMAHAAHDRAGCGGLACFHAGARQCHHRHPVRVERRRIVELAVPDPRRYADALTEERELQHAAEHAAVERRALVGVHRVAHAEHAADVEQLQDVARLHLLGDVARVAEQRLAVAERAHDHVATRHLGHAPAGELEHVVGGLAAEDLHHEHHALLAGDVLRGDANLVAEAAGLGDRGDLVGDDRPHLARHRHSPCAVRPARV